MEPFTYFPEFDGSVSIFVFPFGSRAKTVSYYQAGYVRAYGGGLIASPYCPDFEDVGTYSGWEPFPSMAEAMRFLVTTGAHGCPPGDLKVKAFARSLSYVPEHSSRAEAALRDAGRRAVAWAVNGMLLTSSYDDVMSAVSEALASQVMGS